MRRALLGLAMASLLCGCTASFEKCLTNYAELIAASRVQAALACHGDRMCIETQIASDVELFANQAATCGVEADGGK